MTVPAATIPGRSRFSPKTLSEVGAVPERSDASRGADPSAGLAADGCGLLALSLGTGLDDLAACSAASRATEPSFEPLPPPRIAVELSRGLALGDVSEVLPSARGVELAADA